MEISNSSGRRSSSRNSPWLRFESGEVSWDELPPADKEEVVRHYAPKIKIIGLRLKTKLPANIELGDLISAGSLGLMEALGKFRPELGIKFSTYAESRIKGAMLDDLRRLDWFSRGLRQKMKVLEETIRRLESETGEATTQDICKATGMDEKEVDQGLEMLQNQVCMSLDAIQDNLGSLRKAHLDNDPYHSASFQEIVDKITGLIEELTPREKLVLSLYYGEELNMRETAEVMDITEGRVSQLHSQALDKLKKKFKSQYESEAANPIQD